MKSPDQTSEITPKFEEPSNEAARPPLMLFDLCVYGLLLFQIWNAAKAAYRLQDSLYYQEWVLSAWLFAVGAIWCGWLIWKRRKSSKTSVCEICLAMFLSMAIADTYSYLSQVEGSDFPSLPWFAVLCYFVMLFCDRRARKSLVLTPARSVPELAGSLESDSQALLKRRDNHDVEETLKP